MENFTNIIVPTDGSKHAHRALERAIYLAEKCNAKLILVNVIDLNLQYSISAEELLTPAERVIDQFKKDARSVLDKAMSEIPDTIKKEAALEIGSPAQAIVEFTKKHHGDLIVMGSRGMGTLGQIILGSVSRNVLHYANCPVMVTR